MLFGGGGAVVVIALAVGGAWWFGLFGGRKAPEPVQQAQAQGQSQAAQGAGDAQRAGPPRPHFLDIPEMTVNLSAAAGQGGGATRPSYLRIRISLELADAALAPQIQPVMPRVQDTLQTFLRELRTGDLDGSAGVHRLREELTRRVNLVVQPTRVEAVLFRELLVQ